MKRILLVARTARSPRRSGRLGDPTREDHVYAASSLVERLPGDQPDETYSFAGSNTLATQIKNGAPADVFASANMTLPAQLQQARILREAGRLHAQHARDLPPKANPGHVKGDLQPHEVGRHRRRRGAGRPGR